MRFLGLGLPCTLVLSDNIGQRYLSGGRRRPVVHRASISAYYHTGMGEVFVAILARLGIFLLYYKKPDWRIVIAAKLARPAAIPMALLPTHERLREATCTGARLPDWGTLFFRVG